MQKAAGLYGDALEKQLVECIQKSRTERLTSRFLASGEAEVFEDAEKKYADKPDQWAMILKNAPQFKCPVTGREMIVATPKSSAGIART